MKNVKPNKNGSSARVKFESWMTTDAEERKKRRERAAVEAMKVRSVDVADGFGLYEVSHPAADRRTAVYHVEIRSLDGADNTCDCPDFAKSGLGTCKHVERVHAAPRVGDGRRGQGRTVRSAEAGVGDCRRTSGCAHLSRRNVRTSSA